MLAECPGRHHLDNVRRMLQSLVQLQPDMARQRVKRLLAQLEPAAILLIGTGIVFIMVAVMLAIVSLNRSTL